MNSLLGALGFVGALIFFICSLLFTIFCFFKARQSDGKGFVNDVMTDLGGGSFKEHVLNPFRNIFWNILGTIFILVTLVGAGLVMMASDKKGADTAGTSETTRMPPEMKPPAIPAVSTQVNTSGENPAPVEKTPDTTTPKTQDVEATIKSGQQGVVTQSSDIFSVCENESNFISRNNCKWRICGMDENKLKSECSNFTNAEPKN